MTINPTFQIVVVDMSTQGTWVVAGVLGFSIIPSFTLSTIECLVQKCRHTGYDIIMVVMVVYVQRLPAVGSRIYEGVEMVL